MLTATVTQAPKEFAIDRFILSHTQWQKMEPFNLGKPTDPGRTAGDGRLFLEAVLWIVRTGTPWRDLSPGFRQMELGFQTLSRLEPR